MKHAYVISIITENTLEVLQRLANIFSRNRLFINHLNFDATDKQGFSIFNIEIHSDEKNMERTIKQLQRIIELLDVKLVSKKLI